MSFGESQLVDDANRPLAIFAPSVWDDHFMTNVSQSVGFQELGNTKLVINKLKNEVKKMFETDVVQSAGEMLEFVDAIQRLGLGGHFENEVEANLKKLQDHDTIDDDLYTVALRFRLLRQQCYSIPCDVFMKFKDKEGKFKESLKDDIRGMLSLYEASHLRYHGEEILDEALIFTTTHLKSSASKMSSQMLEQVNHALKHPIRKSMVSREARRYISVYEKKISNNEALLTLAKSEFNNLQLLYKKELNEVTRWRKDFGNRTQVSPFFRERMVASFVWALAVFYEAEHSLARTHLAKFVSALTQIDDIYDNFGTLPELEIFTEDFERWDLSASEKLPDYMKLSYKAILEFYSEVNENLAKEIPYWIDYFKKALLILVRGYFQEAKWLHNKQIPTFDEYLTVAYDTAGSALQISMAFIGMGNDVTQESMAFALTVPEPKIVRALSVVSRLVNDIGYHKSELRKSRRVVPTAVECYSKQYGVTEEEAVSELNERVASAWKDINDACLRPPISRRLMLRVLDVVRGTDEIYRDGEGFTEDGLRNETVESLIIKPIPI